MFEMCTSTAGRWAPSSASRSATLVWVSAPPLMTIPSNFASASSAILSISSPSWFDWKNSSAGRPELRAQRLLQVGQGGVPVDLGLALAQPVEVGSVEDRDLLHSFQTGWRGATGDFRSQ
jgi:hypothetical protein